MRPAGDFFFIQLSNTRGDQRNPRDCRNPKLLTTAVIPTIIIHGNYILCQQKAAGKRFRPAEGIILSGVF